MQKIGDITSTANAVGEYREGSPGAGVDATLIKADWLNTIQRELIAVVADAGIALDPADDAQVAKAIKKLVASAADFHNLLNKPTTLSGYGITDAMKAGAGGLTAVPSPVQGKISDLPGTQFFATDNATTDGPSNFVYGIGAHIKAIGGKAAFDIVSAITHEYFGFRFVAENGAGVFREAWHSGNFDPSSKAPLNGPEFTGNVRVPNVAQGTNNTQAANTAFVRAAIANLVGSSPAALDTLNELAAALGNDPNFAATVTNALANLNVAVAGKFNAAGGQISGKTLVLAGSQGVSSPGFRVGNVDAGSALAAMSLETPISSAVIAHIAGADGITIRSSSGAYAGIDVGNVISNGALAHTTSTFLKPSSPTWVDLSGSGVIPSGGTWAYSVTNYTGGGSATGSIAGVAAGGTTVGAGNCHGFAWRIQ